MTKPATPILDLNRFDRAATGGLAGPLGELARRRARVFGAYSVLFYRQPLAVASASGGWMRP
jgi:hypothetical protein